MVDKTMTEINIEKKSFAN